MRLRFENLALCAALMLGFAGCTGGGSEPNEAQMREAMLYMVNHPPGMVNSDPITIKFFKKEACNKPPTAQGFHCAFDVQVASRNIGASMYNNITFGDFYKDDSGKWAMRPPF
jgi:hypothetical protein